MQGRILTVTSEQDSYAKRVKDLLVSKGWRMELDVRNEKLGFKIREAQLAKIPYAIILGDKEVASQTLAPRRRGGENLAVMTAEEFDVMLRREVAEARGEA